MGLREGHKSRNLRHAWLAAAVVGIVSIALQLGGEEARLALAWNHDAIGAAEAWRLLSGHFVHLGWNHLLLNLAGLALVTWLVGARYGIWHWILILAASIAAMDAGLWLWNPELDWYVGLSGLLHGLLAAGLLSGAIARDREAIVLAVFVLAKLVWEQLAGPLPGSEATAGGAVIVDAHLYGAIGGLLAAAVLQRSVREAAPL